MTSPSEMSCANLGPILCFWSSGPHPIKAAPKVTLACFHAWTVFGLYITLGETTQNLPSETAPLVANFPAESGSQFADWRGRLVCARTLFPSFVKISNPLLMRKLLVSLPPLPVPRNP